MSGGSLNYFYCQLDEHSNDFGDKELKDLVEDLAELFHDREWYLSGDTGVGDWNEARDAFKAKWFTQHGRAERIEKYLDEFATEVRQTFGIGKRYCKSCKHWKAGNRYEGKYGDCEFVKSCVMHRSESCDRWEPKE